MGIMSTTPVVSAPAGLRELYPFKARVLTSNPYGIPVGKEFACARRREGDASPWPIEVFSWAGDYTRYQFADHEVELLQP